MKLTIELSGPRRVTLGAISGNGNAQDRIVFEFKEDKIQDISLIELEHLNGEIALALQREMVPIKVMKGKTEYTGAQFLDLFRQILATRRLDYITANAEEMRYDRKGNMFIDCGDGEFSYYVTVSQGMPHMRCVFEDNKDKIKDVFDKHAASIAQSLETF